MKLSVVSLAMAAAAAVTLPAWRVDAFELPFAKHTLANGLVVVVHEDHSLPIVAVNLWYKVGSRIEEPGRTGFAHLFEHLMYMGTHRVPAKLFDASIEAAGGRNNAWTSEDRTRHLTWGPPQILPLILWLEADRLSSLGNDLGQAQLDAQREVVRSERRETVENSPYGAVEIRLPELSYPKGHPYDHSTIGSHEDLLAASVSDVRTFFDRWYRPNNLVMGIAGDVETPEALALVEKYFSWIPSKPEPSAAPQPPPPHLDGVKRETLYDKVSLPRITMAWHSPARYAAGEAELNLAALILADGRATRLEQALITKTGLAQDVTVRHGVGDLSSQFILDAVASKGVPLDKLEAAIDSELSTLARTPVGEDELNRVKNRFAADLTRKLESVAERANQLCLYEATRGDPGYLGKDIQRHMAVTPEQLRQAIDATLGPSSRVIVHVVPEAERGNSKPSEGGQ